jgi:hypothetical protein
MPFTSRRVRTLQWRFLLPALAVVGTAAVGHAQGGDSASLGALREADARLAARVDSLRGELHDHGVAEDFYNTALDEQANRFVLIVTLAMGLAGLGTFTGFYLQLRRIRAELRASMRDTIEAHERKAADVQARLALNEAFMRRTAGNTYVAISTVYREAAPGLAIAASLLAAGNFYAARSGPDDRTTRLGAENLAYALRMLRSVRAMERATVAEQLERGTALRQEALDLLHQHAGPQTRDLLAHVQVEIGTLLSAAGNGPRGDGGPALAAGAERPPAE